MSPKLCHICGEMLDECPHGRPGLPPEHDGSIARCRRCHKNPAQFCTSCVAEVQAAPLQGIKPAAIPTLVQSVEEVIAGLQGSRGICLDCDTAINVLVAALAQAREEG